MKFYKHFNALISVFLLLNANSALCCPPLPKGNLTSLTIPDPSPSTGDQKILVIMADFSDEPGSFTQQSFYDLLLGSNPTGSMAEYYREVSYGKLRYTGDVVGMNSNVIKTNSNEIAYVRLPNPKSFYSNGSGGVEVDKFPGNAAGLYYHIVQELDNAGFSFAPYADGKGVVRNAIVIFAGRSASESSNLNDLRAQHYSIEYALNGGYQAKDGTLLKTFSLCPERESIGQARIGICTHEQGHSLGLPDLYDHTYRRTVGAYFDLMAAGTFGGLEGKRPFHLSAFSKMKLGWLTPIAPAPSALQINLPPVESQPSALKLAPFEGSSEYFLIENRQQIGFDNLLEERSLCPGLVIWHIDESAYSQYLLANRVNTDPSLNGPAYPSVSIVEQDGDNALLKLPLNYGVCGDTYQPKSFWNDATPGNARLWNGSPSGLRLTAGIKGVDQSINIYLHDPLKGKIALTQKGSVINGKLNTKLSVPAGLVAELRKASSLAIVKSVVLNSSKKFKFNKVKRGNYRIVIGNLSVSLKVK